MTAQCGDPPPHPGLAGGPVYPDYDALTPVDPRVAATMWPVTQVTEHPAVLESCRAFERLRGTRTTVLPVDGDGLVAPPALAAGLTEDTLFVPVMAPNNATGALQPITELAALARARGALFHCDAAQAVGKVSLDVGGLGVDPLTTVGQKTDATQGAAALYMSDGVRLEPVVHGGGQEHGLRAGTENVAPAVALGTATQIAADELASGAPARPSVLREDLHQQLTAALPGRVHANGPDEQRLPNTPDVRNVSIDGVLGHELLAAVGHMAASTDSACHSGTHIPSPVLTAMGLDPDRALGALRLSRAADHDRGHRDGGSSPHPDSYHAVIEPQPARRREIPTMR